MFSERVVRSAIDYLEFCFLFAALAASWAQTAAHNGEKQQRSRGSNKKKACKHNNNNNFSAQQQAIKKRWTCERRQLSVRETTWERESEWEQLLLLLLGQLIPSMMTRTARFRASAQRATTYSNISTVKAIGRATQSRQENQRKKKEKQQRKESRIDITNWQEI